MMLTPRMDLYNTPYTVQYILNGCHFPNPMTTWNLKAECIGHWPDQFKMSWLFWAFLVSILAMYFASSCPTINTHVV